MTLAPYQPIDCGLYDYIEIACLHGYQVCLSLMDGASMSGLASTTRSGPDGEFLVLTTQTETQSVRLDLIAELKVLSQPRTFDSVSFKSE